MLSPSAKSQLTTADSLVTWVDSLRVVGDVDCDGTVDTVLAGYTAKSMHLGVVFGSRKSPHLLAFEAPPMQDDGARGASLVVESGDMDYDPAADDGPGELEGFKRSAQCIDVSLRDGDTDAYHAYWNHQRKVLGWWRR